MIEKQQQQLVEQPVCGHGPTPTVDQLGHDLDHVDVHNQGQHDGKVLMPGVQDHAQSKYSTDFFQEIQSK